MQKNDFGKYTIWEKTVSGFEGREPFKLTGSEHRAYGGKIYSIRGPRRFPERPEENRAGQNLSMRVLCGRRSCAAVPMFFDGRVCSCIFYI